MYLLRRPLLACLFIGMNFLLLGQNWTNKEETSPDFKFQNVVEDFNSYWEGREIGKGKGYKPFMRWVNRWENDIQKNGQLPAAGASLDGYNEYLRRNNIKPDDSRMDWQQLGPNSTTGGYRGTGRINAVGFDPNNTDIIYAGSAGGGLWKTTNGGTNWTPKTDFLGSIGISKIIVHPTNPNTIYIATGDGDASDSYSIGVMKSTDGGDTWNSTGLNWSTSNYRLIREMVMDPDNSEALIVASNNGIYRTTNGGSTWTQEQTGNFYDVEMNPNGSSNTFYAATRTEVYRSTNNGDTWASVYTINGSNRLALATSAANSNYVYVLSSKSSGSGYNGVWRSTDSGATFANRSTSPNLLGWSRIGDDTGGQGWYDLVIAADPSNANTIYVGGVNHWKSVDGGSNWTIKSHWAGSGGIFEVHADKHELEWQGNVLWEGNDGGLYKTTNGGDTWIDLTGDMIISQMYRIGVSEVDTRVMAGLQDNGSKHRQTSGVWVDELGGDGMDCAVNPENGNVMYGCIQNGEIRRSTNGGQNWTDIQNNIPGAPGGAWVTPYVLNPQRPATIIAGFTEVYKTVNQGNSWTSIGSGLGSSKKTILAIAEQDSNYIYVGTSNALWQTTDGGANWTSRSVPGSGTQMVKVSPTNPNTIYAVRSSYSSNTVYKSNDGGASWSNLTADLPQIPARCIAIHNDGDETMYVGLDVGVYYRKQSDAGWTLYNAALPNVQIRELEIRENSDEIFIATYGRGLWKNVTIGQSTLCKPPLSLSQDAIGNGSVTFSWTASNPAPALGYEVSLTQSDVAPSSGTVQTTTTVTYNNLNAGEDYYFYLRSKCAANDASSWISYGPFKLPNTCGPNFYDTGGANANYGDNENNSYTICPSNSGDKVKITFTAFNVETNWDALYVHNGKTTESPLFASTNGATNAGFPAGGYHGSSLPGSFTSTSEDGCITIAFRSDGSVTRLGWDHTSECISPCDMDVNSSSNDGEGTLRSAIGCASSGSVITFDPSLFGTTISLSSKIVIDEDITISIPQGQQLTLSSTTADPVFEILSSGNLTLNYLTLSAGSSNDGAAVQNQGTLILNGINVNKNANNNTPNSLINNNGTMQVTSDSSME